MSADPILTSVIANRLKAIGERMGLVVERSARSPLLVEGRDFSLGIYDADGLALEQPAEHPVAGCAFTIGPKYSPCVRIEWTAGASSSKMNRTAPLVQSSVGKCIGAAG